MLGLLPPRALFDARAFKTEHPYKPEWASEGDIRLASIAFGFTIGFGLFTSWHAWKQSRKLTVYSILCWTEILVCGIFALICWLYLIDVITHSFTFFFIILTCWAIQVQVLLQIIVNRICILVASPTNRFKLKYGVAAFILAIQISVYCIWIPARLQISAHYEDVNRVWDRCEKIIYLIVDAALNLLFIKMVSTRLIDLGLTKYDSLLTFNKRIIAVSLAMDVLIIGLMSLPNSFTYMQFHPVAYCVKLEIEMAMSTIMVKVASASTGIENDADERTTQAVEPKYERRTGPVRVKIVNTVEVEEDPNYPATLREGRMGANRYELDVDEEDEEDKGKAFADSDFYPSALAKYQTFFPPTRDNTLPSTTADLSPSSRSNRDPFVSTDTLEMQRRPTSLNSTRKDINPDLDDD